MTSTTEHHDRIVQKAVEEELEWSPQINSSDIGVAVTGGAVTLTGEVADLAERVAARNAATRVHGVTTVADELVVPRLSDERSDTEIAIAVDHALEWAAQIPRGAVKAEVRDRVVILRGEVEWDYQRRAAKHAVEQLKGVRFVDSRIALLRGVSASDSAERISKALIRNAIVDANSIAVRVDGTEAILTGAVRSWAELRAAEKAAWSAPGVTAVRSEITLRA